MPAYAIAHLQNLNVGDEIIEYIKRIDATLEPYEGRFLVHGGDKTVLEGDFPGDIVVIAFPDRKCALAWYNSVPYQEIIERRTRNSDANVVIVQGVAEGHKSTDILAAL